MRELRCPAAVVSSTVQTDRLYSFLAYQKAAGACQLRYQDHKFSIETCRSTKFVKLALSGRSKSGSPAGAALPEQQTKPEDRSLDASLVKLCLNSNRSRTKYIRRVRTKQDMLIWQGCAKAWTPPWRLLTYVCFVLACASVVRPASRQWTMHATCTRLQTGFMGT